MFLVSLDVCNLTGLPAIRRKTAPPSHLHEFCHSISLDRTTQVRANKYRNGVGCSPWPVFVGNDLGNDAKRRRKNTPSRRGKGLFFPAPVTVGMLMMT